MENWFILNPGVQVEFVASKTFEMLPLNFLRYQKWKRNITLNFPLLLITAF